MCSRGYWGCQSWQFVQQRVIHSLFESNLGTYFAPHAISEFGRDVHDGVGLQIVLVALLVVELENRVVLRFED